MNRSLSIITRWPCLSWFRKITQANNMTEKFSLPTRFKDSSYSVWVEFVDLVASHQPLNLGQGFPDYPATGYIPSVLAEVAGSNNNAFHQYTRGYGHPKLVNVLAKLYSKLIDRPINPMTEVLITCGAYEALYSAVAGFIEPGDEVIIIEPYYDCYEPLVRIFGGTPRFVALKNTAPKDTDEPTTSASWKLDPSELEQAFNEKTKMIILNTPHNPTGKVFSYSELETIATLCKKYNVMCVSDEVYEWLVYKPAKHVRIASLPGMWERTLTIGSAGKTFSVTGWKCGWMYGPDFLVRNAVIAHQNNVYCFSTPIQEALARCFEKEIDLLDTPNCYFQSLPNHLLPKRDAFMKTLVDAGFKPTIPEAGYFVIADWSSLAKRVDLSSEPDKEKDYKFAKWLTKNVKLLAIPPSAFYNKEHKYLSQENLRFCFFKKDETLKEARNILTNWKKSLDGCKL
ncbi:hypothetical protein V9T40_006521 [Parthenolecanium corni]|uniref:Aminotransferase class I/classII large domain-containing protein n=1 Tax=Parthenolecanium corni TaxID=536013 RepID=A0AAN9TPW2_9HEMI